MRALYSRVPDKDESLNEQRWFPEQVIVLPFSWIWRCFAKIHSSKFLEANVTISFVADIIISKYSRSIYFYNNNVSTKFNLIDNNDGEIVSIVNPVFLNSDHIRNWLFIPWYELQTICDNFRSCYHDSLREVLRNQTAHELFARTSFFLLIDFYIRKSMKDTPKKNTSSVIVKSETKKSIRNQGDGSIFHNHCNIEWIMQYGI